jgi:hypothetical protein
MKRKPIIGWWRVFVMVGCVVAGGWLFTAIEVHAQTPCDPFNPPLQTCNPCDRPDAPPDCSAPVECCLECGSLTQLSWGPWYCRECREPGKTVCDHPTDPDRYGCCYDCETIQWGEYGSYCRECQPSYMLCTYCPYELWPCSPEDPKPFWTCCPPGTNADCSKVVLGGGYESSPHTAMS